jgi:hypothetical protein
MFTDPVTPADKAAYAGLAVLRTMQAQNGDLMPWVAAYGLVQQYKENGLPGRRLRHVRAGCQLAFASLDLPQLKRVLLGEVDGKPLTYPERQEVIVAFTTLVEYLRALPR